MKKLTAAWVRKAESDFRVAKTLAAVHPPAHDEVCFHSQQAAEKFFKALLQEWGLPVPKLHELDDLLTMLLPSDASLQVVRRGLRGLSRFAVDYRYPGFHGNRQKAQTALRRAGNIRLEVRTRLGLRTKS
jgi:HEPN domain-containing protein